MLFSILRFSANYSYLCPIYQPFHSLPFMKHLLPMLWLAGLSLCAQAAELTDNDSLMVQARALHTRIFSIDTHTDTPLDFTPYYNIGSREKSQVCLPKMAEGGLDAQYLACWVKQGACDSIGRQKAIRRVQRLVASVHHQIEMNSPACGRKHLLAGFAPQQGSPLRLPLRLPQLPQPQPQLDGRATEGHCPERRRGAGLPRAGVPEPHPQKCDDRRLHATPLPPD